MNEIKFIRFHVLGLDAPVVLKNKECFEEDAHYTQTELEDIANQLLGNGSRLEYREYGKHAVVINAYNTAHITHFKIVEGVEQ